MPLAYHCDPMSHSHHLPLEIAMKPPYTCTSCAPQHPMKWWPLLFILLLGPWCSYAQRSSEVSIVFYNVENLFDTIDQPDIDDQEYTPTGKKQWNSERYTAKLDNLSKVLAASAGSSLPALIGLCEVENEAVAKDLMHNKLLRKGKYRVIHEDSPDQRGIDVALAYRKKQFRYIRHEMIPVALPSDAERPTRDILHVVGMLARKDTIHLFINHWPSRYGGAEKSEPKRIAAARTLRQRVDTILKSSPTAKILIMGDFNDYPSNSSIAETLNAKSPTNAHPTSLINLAAPAQQSGQGSHAYRGEWGMLDQIIISVGLQSATTGASTQPEDFFIVKEPWMLYVNPKNGEEKPNRTYGGNAYYGGFSDHLPVGVKLTLRK